MIDKSDDDNIVTISVTKLAIVLATVASKMTGNDPLFGMKEENYEPYLPAARMLFKNQDKVSRTWEPVTDVSETFKTKTISVDAFEIKFPAQHENTGAMCNPVTGEPIRNSEWISLKTYNPATHFPMPITLDEFEELRVSHESNQSVYWVQRFHTAFKKIFNSKEG